MSDVLNHNKQGDFIVNREAQTLEPATEASTDLIVAEAQRNAVALFTDEQRYSEFYQRVKESVSGFVPDVTTDKGRREIASTAFKVTKAKTTLDKAGLQLTEEWRERVNAVNASRRRMTAELDQLAADVRQPLTEWETAEDARKERCSAMIARLQSEATVQFGETAADVRARHADIASLAFDPAEFEGFAERASGLRQQALAALANAADRLDQEERDRAELDRLRQESAEREERDRLEREKREAAERERAAAQAREREAEHAEERRKAEINAAEERARREADERARAEERQAAEAKLAEERRAREAAEREADEAHRKEEERAAWEAKERREREAREADERHRKVVLEEAAEDITDVFGRKSSEEPTPELLNLARAVANAIAAGTIRHVSVQF